MTPTAEPSAGACGGDPPSIAGHLFDMAWNTRPLCVRYRSLDLVSVSMTVGHADAITQVHWRWGLARFTASHYEVLGAWPAQMTPVSIMGELHLRGVNRIKEVFVDGAELEWGAASPQSRLSDALCSELLGVPALDGRDRVPRKGLDSTVQRLRNSVLRSMRRNGPFAGELAAEKFLLATLEKADRRLWSARDKPTVAPRRGQKATGAGSQPRIDQPVLPSPP